MSPTASPTEEGVKSVLHIFGDAKHQGKLSTQRSIVRLAVKQSADFRQMAQACLDGLGALRQHGPTLQQAQKTVDKYCSYKLVQLVANVDTIPFADAIAQFCAMRLAMRPGSTDELEAKIVSLLATWFAQAEGQAPEEDLYKALQLVD
eukprot:10585773-Alexandrium_andersonii.AAC.1